MQTKKDTAAIAATIFVLIKTNRYDNPIYIPKSGSYSVKKKKKYLGKSPIRAIRREDVYMPTSRWFI